MKSLTTLFVFGMTLSQLALPKIAAAGAESPIDYRFQYLKLSPLSGTNTNHMRMEKCKRDGEKAEGEEHCVSLFAEDRSCFIFNPKTDIEKSLFQKLPGETTLKAVFFWPSLFFGSRTKRDATFLKTLREIIASTGKNLEEVKIGIAERTRTVSELKSSGKSSPRFVTIVARTVAKIGSGKNTIQVSPKTDYVVFDPEVVNDPLTRCPSEAVAGSSRISTDEKFICKFRQLLTDEKSVSVRATTDLDGNGKLDDFVFHRVIPDTTCPASAN